MPDYPFAREGERIVGEGKDRKYCNGINSPLWTFKGILIYFSSFFFFPPFNLFFFLDSEGDLSILIKYFKGKGIGLFQLYTLNLFLFFKGFYFSCKISGAASALADEYVVVALYNGINSMSTTSTPLDTYCHLYSCQSKSQDHYHL